MSVILNGFDMTDVEGQWWGWTISGRGATGHVHPDYRDDLAVAIQAAKIATCVVDELDPGSGPRLPLTSHEWSSYHQPPPQLHASSWFGDGATGHGFYSHHLALRFPDLATDDAVFSVAGGCGPIPCTFTPPPVAWEHWGWELEPGETWSGKTWTDEYTIEPVQHPRTANQAPWASSSQSVQSGGIGAAEGTTYRHSINNDGGIVIAWPAGQAGHWVQWVYNQFADTRITATYVNAGGSVVQDLGEVAFTTTQDAWVKLEWDTPAAPSGSTGIQWRGWANGSHTTPASYWVDEVTITVIEP